MVEKDKAKEIIIYGKNGESVKIDIAHLNINTKAISHIDAKTYEGLSVVYIKAGRVGSPDNLFG